VLLNVILNVLKIGALTLIDRFFYSHSIYLVTLLTKSLGFRVFVYNNIFINKTNGTSAYSP
jgi:hypothetical protein